MCWASRGSGTPSAARSASTRSSACASTSVSRGAAEVDAAVAGAVSRLDRDEVLARLVEQGAPATPVLTPEQATDHPQLRARGFHVASDAGLVAGLPARLASGGRVLATHVPEVDEHPGGFALR